MVTFVTAVAAAAVSALLTLVVKSWLDQGAETRAARRALYVELLTVLNARSNFMSQMTFAFDGPIDDNGDQEQADRISALMAIDASDPVRSRAEACFRLLSRFNVSLVMRVPVEVGPDGFYRHQFEKVQGVDDEVRQLHMRMCLGGIHDEFQAALKALSTQVRKELHGKP